MQALWFLRSAHYLMLINIYMKFRKDNLNGFQVIERTGVWQKDARGKNNMSPNPKAGRHNKYTYQNLTFWHEGSGTEIVVLEWVRGPPLV